MRENHRCQIVTHEVRRVAHYEPAFGLGGAVLQ